MPQRIFCFPLGFPISDAGITWTYLSINGIEQLLPPDQGDLFFFSIRLREEAGATNTLPALIARSRGALESNADAQGRFETALLQAGYSPVHDEEYGKSICECWRKACSR
jgi:hypothetical protein